MGAVAFALAVGVPLGLAGCAAKGEAPRFVSRDGDPAASAAPKPAEPFTLAITPAKSARDLPISTEIGTKVTGGSVTSVSLVDSAGAKVAGAMRDDGTSWVPSEPLRYNRAYTATVMATAASGEKATQKTSFRTMDGRPGRAQGTGLYLFNGNTYGVAMPVVVEFVPGIAAKDRAGVERRLFVRTDPPQPGVWHWVDSGTQAFYRAPEYWRPGTKLTVRVGLHGHPTGGGRYGTTDRSATVTIGRSVVMDVENRTKQMSVYKDGQLIRTIPVSLGKRSTPSSSGTMVVMDKQEKTVFDTRGEPNGGYVVDIEFAQRITWDGEFIHSAPWSIGDQGLRNVSHGCVNMSPENASWLFGLTMIGDPITVRGTERHLQAGNGWTAWDMTWAEYIGGSALPVPENLRNASVSSVSGGAATGSGASPSPASGD